MMTIVIMMTILIIVLMMMMLLMMLMIPVKMEADKKLGEKEVTVSGEVAAATSMMDCDYNY